MPDFLFAPHELKSISQLPAKIQALKDQHPLAIIQAAEGWGASPLPSGYVPDVVAVYYDGSDEEDWLFLKARPKYTNLKKPPSNPSSIVLEIDSQFRYVEIEAKEVLNTLGGVILPQELTDVEFQVQSLIAQLF